MKTRYVALSLAGLVCACATAFGQVPSDAEIHKILVDRLGPENLGVGIVVGVIDANGRRVVAYGSLAKNDTRRLDGNTVFEIGSMTKVFTSLLLMDMVRRGEVALTDPAAQFLAAGVKVPERNKRRITLADLATQSSGLPLFPANLAPKDPDNLFADYSVQQLYDFLSGYKLTNPSYPVLPIPPPVERKEITLDPRIFDRYVGIYQAAPNVLVTMSRDGERFYSQLPGQPKLEVLAESDRAFFLKAVDAQLAFDPDARGTVTQVTVHQNGREMVARRLNEAELNKVRTAEIANRFKAQTQSPGTEAALRQTIQGLQRGQPDYEIMDADVAGRTRQALPQLRASLDPFGALKTLKFTGVGERGPDIYEVKFEHGTAEWRIMLDPDGKIQIILFIQR